MYASRGVCWRCAPRMHLAVPPTYKREAIAWFSSAPTDAASVETAASSNSAYQSSRKSVLENDADTRRRPSLSLKQVIPPSFEKQSRANLDSSSAVALFNDVVRRSGTTGSPGPIAASQPATESRPGQSQPIAATALGEWEIAARMKEISEKPVEPTERLRLFQNDIWPHVKELRGQIPKHLYMSTTKFLAETCDAVAEQGLTRTGVALSKMCATIGKWDLDVRNQLVLSLCHTLISRKHSSSGRNAILEELVELWKHVSQLRRRSQAQNHHGLHFVLPAVDEVIKDMSSTSSKRKSSSERDTINMSATTRALTSIFIQFRVEQSRELIPGLLATMAVLSDPRLARDGSQIKAAPLLNLVCAALEQQPADEGYVRNAFASKIRFPPSKLSELQAYIVAQWPQAVDMVLGKDAAWRQGHASSHSKGPSHASSASSGIFIFHKQLRAAYRSRNTGAIVSIWQDLVARLAHNADLGRQMHEDPEFLDFWIFVWCAVRRPNKLQETLAVMQQVSVQPTVRTYTSMMHGWKICKDSERIEALWHKMVGSGLKLDAIIWTERISGLIEAGRPQAGIQALAEMQAIWKKAVAAKGTPEAAASVAVQPTIEVVNAAFKGLIGLDRHAANEVLAWGGREGIEPNIRTFNILLRESFRSSNSPEDVKSLLMAMKARGIEPDAATFTIILEELLGGMQNASATEQVQVVEQILRDIEAAGLRANLETYGKMLYAVASLANGGADEAIAAVQQHMRAVGLSATPHMVTILIERALSRYPLPPDAGATIRSLLREHRLFNVSQGDQTLWERVMSAHAVTGDVISAIGVFGQLARAGRPVTSLPCLTDLLKALLVDKGDAKAVQDAKEVVHIVLNHKLKKAAAEGELSLGRDGRYWRHHFWFLARENSLINWGDVPPELESKLRGQ
ncbi:bifunctional glutathione transferase/peroxidase [Conoideocrella luteorostrata]|uniref:Bifunctional glutathione transferase/peroxidase n=1 Tax=Conoideocrella luteorostrata TaxID=1105319 RepID=A0AAJ0FX44_9HYPO|nr:bifunctional glutathione transferase/peroxidase [Conoideocrella luteorostrata]